MSEAAPTPARRLVATVHGSVQGVGFRWFVQRAAARLDLEGWVVNQADGTVEVVAEGPPQVLGDLEAALRAGPPAARVREVTVRFEPARGNLSGFSVRSGAHRGD